MVPATLIKRPDGYIPPGTRVISHETSVEMRKLMRLVVTDGTGKNANVQGYLVGGKTGTAEEVQARGYAKHLLLSSFIGVFPINNPEYFVLIVIDQPHGNHKSFGFATAGWTAAPAAARVIARMGPLLGVRPIEETALIHDQITVDQSQVGTKVAAD
jgi:cell division protein FtsI (penicillin-binding protein 3)